MLHGGDDTMYWIALLALTEQKLANADAFYITKDQLWILVFFLLPPSELWMCVKVVGYNSRLGI